jgi:hypothetical protein
MARDIVLHAFLNMHQTYKQEIELRLVDIFYCNRCTNSGI